MERRLYYLFIRLQERNMKPKILVASLIAAGVIAAGAGYEKYDSSILSPAVAASAPAMPASVQPATVPSAKPAVAALPDFTGIVAQNGAAVVNISVTNKTEKVADFSGMPNLDPNDPF